MAIPFRPRRTAFIVLFLAFQVLMPLRYYLSGGGDDERFSWRMFSTTRMHRCAFQVEELFGTDANPGRRKVQPSTDVQVAWLDLLRRNRPAVVERYLERRCLASQADSTRYQRTCVRSDGQALPVQTLTLACKSGELVSEGNP